MANIKVSLEYSDLQKMMEKDPSIVMEIRAGIIKTFIDSYLEKTLNNVIKEIDMGSLKRAITLELNNYFTGNFIDAYRKELSPHFKTVIRDELIKAQADFINEGNRTTLLQAAKLVSTAREEILDHVNTLVDAQITQGTKDTIKLLVADKFNKLIESLDD